MKALISFFILNSLLLAGCTVYESGGRKQFESDASSNAKISSFELQSCRQESRIQSWLQEEFPAQNYELILADDDLEVWKTNKNSSVEIKALQKNETGELVCTYSFASETVWNQNQESFISELRNNLMTE